MTLKHRLWYRNRKINICNCMVLVQMPWKVAIFSHSKCYNTTFLKGITRNLLHTFFRDYSSTAIPVFENLEIGFSFAKIKMLKISPNRQNFRNFTNPRKQFCSSFFPEYTNHFRLSLSLKMSVWQRLHTLIFTIFICLCKPLFLAEHDFILTSLTADLS